MKIPYQTIWLTILMRFNFFRILLSAILLIVSSLGVNAKTYLLSVGICDYSSFFSQINNLLLPVKDANAIINLYAHNASVDYVVLTDKKATRSNILRAMNKLYTLAGDDDRIVFFFSGHGYSGGICASDTIIEYSDIKKSLAKVKSKTKILFVDACRSGSFRKNDEKKGVSHSDSESILFLASRNNENSIERRDMKNGFFTEYLVKGLKGNADSNRDRKITTKELFDFVSSRVAIQSNGLKHPVMWGNFNDSTIIIEW